MNLGKQVIMTICMMLHQKKLNHILVPQKNLFLKWRNYNSKMKSIGVAAAMSPPFFVNNPPKCLEVSFILRIFAA